MKKIVSILMVVLMAVLFCVPATAETYAQEVKVRTKDMQNNAVVAGVEFAIYRKNITDNETTYTLVTTSKTNSNGVRSVSLTPGSYKAVVKTAPSGYAKADTLWFTVKADIAKDVILLMPPQFTLKLTVLNCKGNPVSNAEIWLDGDKITTTGSDGLAVLRNVRYGSCKIKIIKSVSGDRMIAFEQDVTLEAGANKTLKKTIQLPPKSKWRSVHSAHAPRCD